MNENVITRKHLFGTHEMRWDEVQLIEMQPSNDKLIVLRGANKSLVIPGTDIWAGEDKEAMTQLFLTKSLRAAFPSSEPSPAERITRKTPRFVDRFRP